MKILRIFFLLLAAPAFALAAPDSLRITGSNTFGEKLGPLLVANFARKNPGIDIALKRPGSGEGLAALINGQADLAPTSRPANRAELQAASAKGLKLIPQNIGSYGITIIVNDSNPAKNLRPAQVRAIFNGKISNWNQLRGHDKTINVFILDRNTGARAGFQSLAMHGDDYAASAKALRSYADIVAAVSADPYAIGYADMAALPAGVRSVLINGQPANSASIYERVYPYASPLYLYSVERAASKPVKKFVRFVLSKEGQQIIQKAGYVPRLTPPPSVTSGNIAP